MVKKICFFIIILMLTLIITLIDFNKGQNISLIALDSFKQMLAVLPPIMLLLGLLDTWVPRQTMIKYMGDNSGILGIVLAILLGALAAGPVYAAFPVTAVFIKKGAKFSNIMIFMGAWCATKIPTFLFELSALGYKYTFSRLLVNLPSIIILAYLIEGLLSKNDLEKYIINLKNEALDFA
ncbi:permease [Clostridium botulinum]|nr:permease [Clostridium botulinum]